MQKIVEQISNALTLKGFSIYFSKLIEGLLTERYEIKFSKGNIDYKIQIYEAIEKYPGFINYNYKPSNLTNLIDLIIESMKAPYQSCKYGSTTGKDFYLKINSRNSYYDIYVDKIE